MSDLYPLIGNVIPVNVASSGFGRPMLRDARKDAPSPCNTCQHLSLSRTFNGDALSCRNPRACPAVDVPHDPAVDRFIDMYPTTDTEAMSQACAGCVYRKLSLTGVYYCCRAEESIELCPARKKMTPVEYTKAKPTLELTEFEAELNQLQELEVTSREDFGSF